jgi:hypothetical protein
MLSRLPRNATRFSQLLRSCPAVATDRRLPLECRTVRSQSRNDATEPASVVPRSADDPFSNRTIPSRPDSLQDLVKTNGLVGVNPNGSTAAYFATSKDSLATQLQPNVRYCDSATCTRWVREGVVQAFVTDQPVLLYLSQQQPCNTAVVGDPFGPGEARKGAWPSSLLAPCGGWLLKNQLKRTLRSRLNGMLNYIYTVK